jgi:hypothetical protein
MVPPGRIDSNTLAEMSTGMIVSAYKPALENTEMRAALSAATALRLMVIFITLHTWRYLQAQNMGIADVPTPNSNLVIRGENVSSCFREPGA